MWKYKVIFAISHHKTKMPPAGAFLFWFFQPATSIYVIITLLKVKITV